MLGSVTAGNASSINDGAAAVMMMSESKAQELDFPSWRASRHLPA
jgi:acetyl-CoA C-acetyltransferase